jgi:tetratricopeptide (TPR) repeat protein
MAKGNRLFSLIILTSLVLALVAVIAQAEVDNKAKEAYNKGVTAAKAGKADEAIAAYKEAIGIDANYFDAYMNLGALLFEKGTYDDALKAFQTASEKNPKSVEAFANVGRVNLTKRSYVEAEAAYKKAIALDDKNVELQKELAKLYKQKGDYPSLVQTCDKINQMNGADDQTWFLLGFAYAKLDKTTEAVAALEKSIALKPKNAPAQSSLGQIYLGKEDYVQAAKCFKAALAADPKNYAAASNYAMAIETKSPDDYATNIANWVEFIRVAGSNPRAKDAVATAQQHVKELKDAQKAKGK